MKALTRGDNLLCKLKYDEQGLIPAVIQDTATGEVLMLAYMNRPSLERTLDSGKTWFYSRSRRRLWQKGESSGNYQRVREIHFDCDGDTLLIKVDQKGFACHKGEKSCFHNLGAGRGNIIREDNKGIIDKLYNLICQRYERRPRDSYTAYLFDEGQDKILKKIGEEASEVIIGSKNQRRSEVIHEISDLIFHLLVLLVYHKIKPENILGELSKRHEE